MRCSVTAMTCKELIGVMAAKKAAILLDRRGGLKTTLTMGSCRGVKGSRASQSTQGSPV